MLSIAMVFPLVFSIRGSFRRREKALEHLSKFRSALKTVHYLIMSNTVVTEERKTEMSNILVEISEQTMLHLRSKYDHTKDLDEIINKVHQFILAQGETLSRGVRDKVFRFMKDLHESVENLHAINTHRTPISLKAYCKIFIYIFPIIYAPSIIGTIGAEANEVITYFVVILTEFILISLFNIQDQLEYPFDDDLDDIKLDAFKINR
ncbi:MAG: hypothetical protein KJN76_10810 [Eudoraea sp.]|nr:hypothetical protein [Eudoraea sp.]